MPFSLVSTYWSALRRGMNRIVLPNAWDVALKGGGLVLVAVFLVKGRFGIAGAVWADTIATFTGAVVIGGFLARTVACGRPSFNWQIWRRTLGFALPAYAGMVAAHINYPVDELIVAPRLSPADSGFYVIAVALAERLWLLTGAVANALPSHLTNHPRRDPELPAAVARHVMLWTAARFLAVLLLSDALIELLFGADFAPTAAPLRWLLPGIFTLSVGKVSVAELLAREKPAQASWATVIATAVNLAANLALVPTLGISGATIASSVACTFLSTLITWFYLRETGLSWTRLLPRSEDMRPYVILWRRLAYSVVR